MFVNKLGSDPRAVNSNFCAPVLQQSAWQQLHPPAYIGGVAKRIVFHGTGFAGKKFRIHAQIQPNGAEQTVTVRPQTDDVDLHVHHLQM